MQNAAAVFTILQLLRPYQNFIFKSFILRLLSIPVVDLFKFNSFRVSQFMTTINVDRLGFERTSLTAELNENTNIRRSWLQLWVCPPEMQV